MEETEETDCYQYRDAENVIQYEQCNFEWCRVVSSISVVFSIEGGESHEIEMHSATEIDKEKKAQEVDVVVESNTIVDPSVRKAT